MKERRIYGRSTWRARTGKKSEQVPAGDRQRRIFVKDDDDSVWYFSVVDRFRVENARTDQIPGLNPAGRGCNLSDRNHPLGG